MATTLTRTLMVAPAGTRLAFPDQYSNRCEIEAGMTNAGTVVIYDRRTNSVAKQLTSGDTAVLVQHGNLADIYEYQGDQLNDALHCTIIVT